jgi:xanthine dehydrogenase accessory factor
MTKWIILAVVALTVAAAGVQLWAAGSQTHPSCGAQARMSCSPGGCGGQQPAAQPAADEATCPVMGKTLKKADMTAYEYKGTTYYFCCPGCIDTFKADPAKYTQPAH